MNLEEYKQKKISDQEAISKEFSMHRDLCSKCMRPRKACFCETIKSFSTNVEFRILMHPMEARKEHVGTGRLTKIAMKNCEIIVDKDFDQNRDVQSLINSETHFSMILYPGKKSLNISKEIFPKDYFQGKTPVVFVLDGTWPCAKSMMRDSKTLHDLPRISFDSSIESQFVIKHQPLKFCLSTIESIYHVLVALEKQGLEQLGNKKEELITTLQKLVDFQIKCASDPNLKSYKRTGSGQYKKPSERAISKKWENRKVCFED